MSELNHLTGRFEYTEREARRMAADEKRHYERLMARPEAKRDPFAEFEVDYSNTTTEIADVSGSFEDGWRAWQTRFALHISLGRHCVDWSTPAGASADFARGWEASLEFSPSYVDPGAKAWAQALLAA